MKEKALNNIMKEYHHPKNDITNNIKPSTTDCFTYGSCDEVLKAFAKGEAISAVVPSGETQNTLFIVVRQSSDVGTKVVTIVQANVDKKPFVGFITENGKFIALVVESTHIQPGNMFCYYQN